MTEMPKGMKMALGLIGITPEMMASPETMLRALGIEPEKITKPLATFEQIAVRMMNAMAETNVRLARIERQLGISIPVDGRDSAGSDGAGSGDVRSLEPPPPDRRN